MGLLLFFNKLDSSDPLISLTQESSPIKVLLFKNAQIDFQIEDSLNEIKALNFQYITSKNL